MGRGEKGPEAANPGPLDSAFHTWMTRKASLHLEAVVREGEGEESTAERLAHCPFLER